MLKVLVVGLGPIGVACARAVIADRGLELVGLVDADAAKTGKMLDDLGDAPPPATEGDDECPIRVSAGLDEPLAASGGADVAILTTSSRLDKVAPTLAQLLAHRTHIVSSCEEMAWPRYAHADLADQIDAQAKAAGRAVVGTGVNPGFVMDYLAIVLSGMVRRVKSVKRTCEVNAFLCRLPLQAEVGATMSVEEFKLMAQAGRIGHMGLAESVALLAAGLGRTVPPGSVQVTLEPVVATQPFQSMLGLIQPGRVSGIHNVARWSGEDLSIELDLTMALGLPEPKDLIEVNGPVPLKLKIIGGIPGDSATVAAMLNYAHQLPRASPGLHTVLDLPPAGCVGRD